MAAAVKPTELPRPDGIIEVDRVLDIGVGLRPMGWYKPKLHVCVEPHGPYADMLTAAGYNVWRLDAHAAAARLTPGEFEAVYMFDVIEHMPRPVGEIVLDLLDRLKLKQIVVATPHGFLKQHGDAWDMGGDYWQEHRSGWWPSDFPGWRISNYKNGSREGGFVAISP